MRQFHYTAQADADMDEIAEYFSVRNPDAGLRIIDEIEAICRFHALFPRTGRPREELGTGILASIAGS